MSIGSVACPASLRLTAEVGRASSLDDCLVKHSMKMMWGCVAILALVVILSVAGANVGFLLFAIPCMIMMGAMVWMMVRGMGGGSHGSGTK